MSRPLAGGVLNNVREELIEMNATADHRGCPPPLVKVVVIDWRRRRSYASVTLGTRRLA
jgi:hypothetical protein